MRLDARAPRARTGAVETLLREPQRSLLRRDLDRVREDAFDALRDARDGREGLRAAARAAFVPRDHGARVRREIRGVQNAAVVQDAPRRDRVASVAAAAVVTATAARVASASAAAALPLADDS